MCRMQEAGVLLQNRQRMLQPASHVFCDQYTCRRGMYASASLGIRDISMGSMLVEALVMVIRMANDHLGPTPLATPERERRKHPTASCRLQLPALWGLSSERRVYTWYG
mmetsp:Transcript_80784/g.142331  ORF Transcript_80784/g.142331 Transcript_80784/m.142331 type:complete len:109 (+) Transcript_80784:3805-4131(+)